MGEEGFFSAKRAKELKDNPAATVFEKPGGGFTIDSTGMYMDNSYIMQGAANYVSVQGTINQSNLTVNIPRQSGKSYYQDYYNRIMAVRGNSPTRFREDQMKALGQCVEKHPRLTTHIVKEGRWDYQAQQNVWNFTSKSKFDRDDDFTVSEEYLSKQIVPNLPPRTGPKLKKGRKDVRFI